MRKPLAIDLFCGLGGWTEGLLAEGYDVIGFDIEQHVYGDHRYPAQLVIQDVRTLHGSQFRNADLIVASPPCQEYSYMAMPWSRAKAKAAAIRADKTGGALRKLNELFDACFRIQREADGVPMVVENVRGAQPWVGRARWSFGSFYLWGDVPALMPVIVPRAKRPGHDWNRFNETGEVSPHWRLDGEDSRKFNPDGTQRPPGSWLKIADSKNRGERATKNNGGSWFAVAHNTTSGKGKNPDGRKIDGVHGYERDHPNALGWPKPGTSSHSPRRKAASAMIAKIPLALSRHIAATYKPETFALQAAE